MQIEITLGLLFGIPCRPNTKTTQMRMPDYIKLLFILNMQANCDLLVMKIRYNYPDRITTAFSIYTSPTVIDVVVEPYTYSSIIAKQ